MNLTLTVEEADLLRGMLDSAISDMSPEIADTDNPHYRKKLRARRDGLTAIRSRLIEMRATA